MRQGMKSGTGRQCNRSQVRERILEQAGRDLSSSGRPTAPFPCPCPIWQTLNKVGKLFLKSELNLSHWSGGKILPLLSSSWQSPPSCLKLVSILLFHPSLNNFSSSGLSLQVKFSGLIIILIAHLWARNLQVSCLDMDIGFTGVECLSHFPLHFSRWSERWANSLGFIMLYPLGR